MKDPGFQEVKGKDEKLQLEKPTTGNCEPITVNRYEVYKDKGCASAQLKKCKP